MATKARILGGQIIRTFTVAKKVIITKNNIGRKVYLKKEDQVTEGIIKGLMFDKRVNLEYYRVITNDGRLIHIRTNRIDIFTNR